MLNKRSFKAKIESLSQNKKKQTVKIILIRILKVHFSIYVKNVNLTFGFVMLGAFW